MTETSTRRRFLRQVLTTLSFVPGAAMLGALEQAPESASPWPHLPKFDGFLAVDRSAREAMAEDLGRHYHRVPLAVLKPQTAQDVVKIVRFARSHGLKTLVRGQGHSPYGQTLLEGGIVIDSSTLNKVKLAGGIAEAQAGASWEDVTGLTLTQGLTPPAMGDTMTLSVGGILSAGGVSNRSHLFGAVVDNVEELEVVTGAGEHLRCSARHDRELFELILVGMGQCGLIVSARLRLVRAPAYVVRRDFVYEDLGLFLADAKRLAVEGTADHLGAYIAPAAKDKAPSFRINIGRFCDSHERADFSPFTAGMHFVSQGDSVSTNYSQYLEREAARNAAAYARRKAAPRRRLFLTAFVPISRAEEFLSGILASSGETAGVSRFSIYIHPRQKFTRPLLVVPEEETLLSAWIFREPDDDEYGAALQGFQALVRRMHSVGGKAYPPYAPFYRRRDWVEHYGLNLWSRLVAGKSRFDPSSILTPSVGMFADVDVA